jgi:hypothetical protein
MKGCWKATLTIAAGDRRTLGGPRNRSGAISSIGLAEARRYVGARSRRPGPRSHSIVGYRAESPVRQCVRVGGFSGLTGTSRGRPATGCSVIGSGAASAARGLLLASYSPPEHAISPGSPFRKPIGDGSSIAATAATRGGGGDTSASCVLLCEHQKFSARMASRSTSRLVRWPWSGGRNSGRHIPASRTSGFCVVSR